MTHLSFDSDLPVQAWLEAARVRRSRRSYDDRALPDGAKEALEELCQRFRPNPVARAVFIDAPPAGIFSGIVGSYGRISGARAALAFVGIADAPGVEAKVGYTGEAIVLEATRIGLSTCWVAGLFKPGLVGEIAGIGGGERVFAISPVGLGASSITGTERLVYGMKEAPKSRRSAEEIAPGHSVWPPWARAGVEAARIAPSAMNRQPWRFRYQEGAVIASFDGPEMPRVSKKLDCGIAMLHYELGARHAGAPGSWELLGRGADVARYVLI